MLRIGALRGSGRKRTAGNSPRCARLKHPAVFFSFGLHCSALRPREPNTDSRQARYRFAVKIAKRFSSDKAEGESGRNVAKHRNVDLAAVPTPLLGRPRCIRAPCETTRSTGPKGVRRIAPVRPACLRIAKAIRVLAASLRTEHRSAPARFAPARNPGVLFLCLLSFGQAKESESHCSAKQQVRRTREFRKTRRTREFRKTLSRRTASLWEQSRKDANAVQHQLPTIGSRPTALAKADPPTARVHRDLAPAHRDRHAASHAARPAHS